MGVVVDVNRLLSLHICIFFKRVYMYVECSLYAIEYNCMFHLFLQLICRGKFDGRTTLSCEKKREREGDGDKHTRAEAGFIAGAHARRIIDKVAVGGTRGTERERDRAGAQEKHVTSHDSLVREIGTRACLLIACRLIYPRARQCQGVVEFHRRRCQWVGCLLKIIGFAGGWLAF